MAKKLAYIFDQIIPARTAESEQLISTLSALSDIGYECTLFLPASNRMSCTTAEELRDFYHVHGRFRLEQLHSCFPGPRLLEKVAHPALCATLLRKKLQSFDLVYSRNIPAISAALASGIPVMYDTYRPWPAQYGHVLSPFFSLIFRHPKFLGAALHSAYARQAYIDAGLPENKTLVAYNGYNPDIYAPVLSRDEARQKLGLSLERPLAIYSGRMDSEKGIDSLLTLAERTPQCDFILIGSHHHGPLEARADKLSNVKYYGWFEQKELVQWLYAADFLLLPLSSKPAAYVGNTVLPIKIFNYLAAGRAIVAPASPDIVELLNETNACIIQPDDAEDAVQKFHSLLEDSHHIQALAQAASETAKLLTWHARAQKLDEFIERRMQEIGV